MLLSDFIKELEKVQKEIKDNCFLYSHGNYITDYILSDDKTTLFFKHNKNNNKKFLNEVINDLHLIEGSDINVMFRSSNYDFDITTVFGKIEVFDDLKKTPKVIRKVIF